MRGAVSSGSTCVMHNTPNGIHLYFLSTTPYISKHLVIGVWMNNGILIGAVMHLTGALNFKINLFFYTNRCGLSICHKVCDKHSLNKKATNRLLCLIPKLKTFLHLQVQILKIVLATHNLFLREGRVPAFITNC